MSQFMTKYYKLLPNDIQHKINNIVYNNYVEKLDNCIKKYSLYIPYNDDLVYNEISNSNSYPHYFGEYFRYPYNSEIGKGLCHIGDIVFEIDKKDTFYIVIGYNYCIGEDHIYNKIVNSKDITINHKEKYYNIRYLLLSKINLDINKINLDISNNNYNDIIEHLDIDIINMDDNKLYNLYWDYYFMISIPHINYHPMELVNQIHVLYGIK